MLLSLVVLPSDAEAHHTLWLCEPLEHGNKLGALLDSWLKGLEDFLNSLVGDAHVDKRCNLATNESLAWPKKQSCCCFAYLKKFFLFWVALGDLLEQVLHEQQ